MSNTEPPTPAIRCRYHWTADQLGASQRLHAKAQRWWQKLAPALLGLVFAFYGLKTLVAPEGDLVALVLGLLLVAGGAFLLTLRTWFAVWVVKRRHARRPDCGNELVHSLDEQGVHTVLTGLAESRVTWDHFVRAVIGPAGVLLFLTPRQYQWVPHAPLGDGDVERLHALVRSKVENLDEV